MKLYATTTSERASKGQGGNKYIQTELYIGNAKNPMFIGKLKLYLYEDIYCLDYNPAIGDIKILERIPVPYADKEWSKGNKQKDDSGKDGICVACRGKNPEGCTYCY